MDSASPGPRSKPTPAPDPLWSAVYPEPAEGRLDAALPFVRRFKSPQYNTVAVFHYLFPLFHSSQNCFTVSGACPA
jgi:hypothetical protein